MNIPRKILKIILGLLSRWAIRKHQIEVIVVAGYSGSEVVREGIYQILKEKFVVRRNTAQISWDMSIPLAVLGYKDRRYSSLEWFGVITRAIGTLVVRRGNPHTLVLNANCKFDETAKFWSSFLTPNYFVAMSGPDESEIVKNILKNLTKKKSVLIYDNSKLTSEQLGKYKYRKAMSFGEISTKPDLSFDTKRKELSYKGRSLKIPTIVPLFTYNFIAAVFLTVINHQLSFEEAGVEALKFDLGLFLTKRIKENIERPD